MIRSVLPPRRRITPGSVYLLAFLAGCATPTLARPVLTRPATEQEIRGVGLSVWTIDFTAPCEPSCARPAMLCLNGPAPEFDGCVWNCKPWEPEQ